MKKINRGKNNPGKTKKILRKTLRKGGLGLYIVSRPLLDLLTVGSYYLSRLLPRDGRTWCFTEGQNSFYLFLQLASGDAGASGVKPRLLVRSRRRARELSQHYPGVATFFSPRGLWYQLRGSRIFLTHSMPASSMLTMGGAEKTNLWHGIGIKNMGAINRVPHQDKWLKDRSPLRLLKAKVLKIRPDSLLATSPATREWLAKCFAIPESRVFISGYPRLDVIGTPVMDRYLALPGSPYPAVIDKFKAYDRIILYMPTWREGKPGFFTDLGFDLDRLQRIMEAQNALFVFKFHPYTRLPEGCKDRYPNLLFFESDVDVYPLLDKVDLLITDYSSIYYDFLYLGDREVLMFPFDEEEYINDARGVYFDYDADMPGDRVRNFAELADALAPGRRHPVPGRDRILAKFWTPGASLRKSLTQDS